MQIFGQTESPSLFLLDTEAWRRKRHLNGHDRRLAEAKGDTVEGKEFRFPAKKSKLNA
jgi:hypothetical protein